MRPLISFLTDFGADVAAAVCRGVILGICPEATILDISHAVRKFAVADGAWRLVFALPYLPVGIHVAVVDPGVGTERRPIGLRVGRGDVLIGPDNGLLVPAAEALGGIVEARLLSNPSLCRETVSSTFHGRDIFAPMAAHLATGVPFEAVGPTLPPEDLVRLPEPQPRVDRGGLETVVVFVDGFGNAYVAGTPEDLEAAIGPLTPGRPLRLRFGDPDGPTVRLTWQRTFGEVPRGALLLYRSSTGLLAASENQGSIAERLGLAVGLPVRIEPLDAAS
ncbi:MAG TPA: SAM-dependent chlorinase/fluorinase [Candidatus Binatia bacterium]|nr:SAM-dependent chlorinase/fluorinase [Candidatus Binatia bacterium]